MDEEINEFGLWHGTQPEIADILATSGFDERVGGDTNGGLKASRHHCLYIVEISKSGNGGFTTAVDDSSDTCDDVLRLRGLRRPMTELHWQLHAGLPCDNGRSLHDAGTSARTAAATIEARVWWAAS